ncbi:DUF551 domain-containing protein [Burkholderia stagnalis]|nr:DUF551 domain-containing protein [Burkholderia stagnalis]RQY01108.1 DUF551 domain-containing protein [Burkholderia stagnalis]
MRKPRALKSDSGKIGTPDIRTTYQEIAMPPVWISTNDSLPEDETPVLIVHNGAVAVGELRWERPLYEETFSPFRYWDDPNNDGQDWDWCDVTHWMPIPSLPHVGPEESPELADERRKQAIEHAVRETFTRAFPSERTNDVIVRALIAAVDAATK